jgi:hypothetical protein
MRTHQGVALLVALSAMLPGCDSSADKQPSSPVSTVATHSSAPAYRVGQFCFPKRESQYRSGGFTCRGKHLRKRA